MAIMVSEENEEAIVMDTNQRGKCDPCPFLAYRSACIPGKYCIAFDPLDGSSNIDCNVSTGTIFAVYEKTTPGIGTTADILRTGNDIVAAGYCMYGAATELVMCFKGSGVERFALDPSLGEFIHTHTNVRTLTRTEPPP